VNDLNLTNARQAVTAFAIRATTLGQFFVPVKPTRTAQTFLPKRCEEHS
jgi:hypothetical protein